MNYTDIKQQKQKTCETPDDIIYEANDLQYKRI